MLPSQLIRRKRDGESLPPADLAEFFRSYDSGRVADYQMAAFLMAVHFRGLDAVELKVLVETILDSGQRVQFSGPGPRVDKHSTGGVGDTVSLVLAPLAASLGVRVPMMSGRGLAHSGGTVDKLESIPGMRLDLSLSEFRAQVDALGLALISQTPEIAPLDGRLYGLRDVTATVESVPLIAASIMSKKVAEGIDGLVLDVKVGNGAFMTDEARALELARTMIGVGRDQGLDTVALLTAMDRPLGRAIGNALEVKEAMVVLRGDGPSDLREVTVALVAEMLVLSGLASDPAAGRSAAEGALDDGRALDLFRKVVEAQDGDPGVVDDPDRLPAAPVRRPVTAERSGIITAMDTRAMGEAAVGLGAGRSTLDEAIDPAVGFVLEVNAGSAVTEGQPLARVHAADEEAAGRAAEGLRRAITIEEGSGNNDGTPGPGFRPLVSHRVTRDGVARL